MMARGLFRLKIRDDMQGGKKEAKLTGIQL